MSTGVIIILALTAVVILALVFARPATRGGVGGGLRKRFGPEYERTLARHDGNDRATKAELRQRLKRHGRLREKPLSPEAREQYVAQWAGVQEQFVDSPAAAVAAAEQLLTRLIHDRGYRAESHEDRIEALSVHRAHHVDGYRRVHAVAGRVHESSTETEELREALVHARELFEQLVTSGPRDGKASAERTASHSTGDMRPAAGEPTGGHGEFAGQPRGEQHMTTGEQHMTAGEQHMTAGDQHMTKGGA
ncbi:hypothetical protein [Streptomyces meridianus]|uniref:Secreted protein n=1 Tax=Streptomyces meridianus TaxID=2938945 RepID=A0ABT0XBJ0_9ACTN|nr:hypothetical protein [Streptomyces meridianus]MCM2579303.1 hypothetical protein [Streptomyces meridianus]